MIPHHLLNPEPTSKRNWEPLQHMVDQAVPAEILPMRFSHNPSLFREDKPFLHVTYEAGRCVERLRALLKSKEGTSGGWGHQGSEGDQKEPAEGNTGPGYGTEMGKVPGANRMVGNPRSTKRSRRQRVPGRITRRRRGLLNQGGKYWQGSHTRKSMHTKRSTATARDVAGTLTLRDWNESGPLESMVLLSIE